MAKLRSGDITQVLIDGREFEAAGDSNVTYRLSGLSVTSNPTGTGGVHNTGRRKLGGFESLPLSINPENEDLEFLQDVANGGEPVPMSITLVTGHTYSGKLTIQEAVDGTTGDGQVEITASGEKFEQI